MPSRRELAQVVATLGLGLLAPRPSLAQVTPWPDRPVRAIVPFGPGGAPDILARIMSRHFPQVARGQQLVVENRSGAGATIGATHVAQARPDGLTLLLAEQGGAALAHELHQDLPYDPRRSFAPIIWLVDLPMVLVVRPGLPAQTLPELLDLVRQRPGGLSYATVGVGHSAHLASEAMLSRLGPGAQMLPVTYRSGGDIMAALIKGEVDMNIASYASALSFLQAGAVRPLAVSTATRLPELPDVPTMAETLPGLTATLWYGLSGPVGMPPALVTEVNGVFNALLAIPELREAVRRQLAADPVGGPPERFADHLQAEITRWTPVVRAAAAKPQ
jgi:tripartite-type tricarboxylate transporter receptor subunit TctC